MKIGDIRYHKSPSVPDEVWMGEEKGWIALDKLDGPLIRSDGMKITSKGIEAVEPVKAGSMKKEKVDKIIIGGTEYDLRGPTVTTEITTDTAVTSGLSGGTISGTSSSTIGTVGSTLKAGPSIVYADSTRYVPAWETVMGSSGEKVRFGCGPESVMFPDGRSLQDIIDGKKSVVDFEKGMKEAKDFLKGEVDIASEKELEKCTSIVDLVRLACKKMAKSTSMDIIERIDGLKYDVEEDGKKGFVSSEQVDQMVSEVMRDYHL